MKKFSFCFLIIILIVLPLLTGCNGDETTPTPTSTGTPTPTTTTPTPTAAANWWDYLGEPEYGGTLTIREGEMTGMSWDPSSPFGSFHTQFYCETMFQMDWTVDREIWAFNMGYTPIEYMTGCIAESWEQTDPLTWVVNIRQGIHWQDKPPVNGRELTAEDVQYSYDWLLGTGSGFTEPNMFWPAVIGSVDRVVATGDYTVEYRLKEPSATALMQIMEGAVMRPWPIVPHEWVEQGDTQKWENAVGTGPFFLTDFSESLAIYDRNPDYWGYDERHPQNQLPYIDTLKMVAIENLATSLAALRTGQIDMIVQTRGGLSWQQGESLAETNPEIEQVWFPNPGYSIDMRCDHEPFTDIKVRKALQMAIDRDTIAETHYGGYVTGVPTGVSSPVYTGWVLPFDEWPADLQAEYSFNPTRAKELLAEAGHPNGFETNCLASTTDDLDLLQIIKSYFADIGVNMEIEAVDGSTFRAMSGSGEHDQMIMTQATSMPFSPDWCLRFRESTNTRDNFTFNNDATYDDMIRQYDAATTLEEAMQISVEADQYLLEQHWSVQTFRTAVPFAWQPYVKGYTSENVIGSYGYVHVPTRLWIDQAMKASMQ